MIHVTALIRVVENVLHLHFSANLRGVKKHTATTVNGGIFSLMHKVVKHAIHVTALIRVVKNVLRLYFSANLRGVKNHTATTVNGGIFFRMHKVVKHTKRY